MTVYVIAGKAVVSIPLIGAGAIKIFTPMAPLGAVEVLTGAAILFWRPALIPAAGLIGAFIAVNVAKLVMGDGSCDCLGTFGSPKWMLALDLVMLTGAFCVHRTWLMPIALILGVGSGIVYSRSSDRFVVLDDQLVGKPFPWHHTNCRQGVANRLIVYRAGCDHCVKLIRTLDSVEGVALMQIRDGQSPVQSPAHHCQLTSSVEWIVQTPLVIEIEAEKVKSVSSPDLAIGLPESN